MSIHKKILEFQKSGVTLEKKGLNPHFSSSYVTLNEVLDKVKDPLNKLGVLILQTSEATGLRTILKDPEDDSLVECFMPYTETSTAQKLGSNLTYLRRYSLVTLLGLGDEDDDGNAASTPKIHIDPTVAAKYQDAPNCAHGPAKRIQVKKEGPNKGRFFFACGQPKAQQCDTFVWEDEYLASKGKEPVIDEDGDQVLPEDDASLPF